MYSMVQLFNLLQSGTLPGIKYYFSIRIDWIANEFVVRCSVYQTPSEMLKSNCRWTFSMFIRFGCELCNVFGFNWEDNNQKRPSDAILLKWNYGIWNWNGYRYSTFVRLIVMIISFLSLTLSHMGRWRLHKRHSRSNLHVGSGMVSSTIRLCVESRIRWHIFRKSNASSRLHHDVGSVAGFVWRTNGWIAVFASFMRWSVLGRRHFGCSR